MIGRDEELQHLQQFAAPIFDQTFSGIICIYGEAGIGKSRLAYALQEALLQQHTVDWFNCPADQVLHKPFNPFITCFMRYFEQASENTEEENKARFEEKYDALVEALHPGMNARSESLSSLKAATSEPPQGASASLHPGMNARPESSSSLKAATSEPPQGDSASLSSEPGALAPGILHELLRTKSVIGAQLGLSWKDSLWEQLDAKGKYENTVSAIKNFFLAHSLRHPVVIELEDGHWLDSDSLVVVQALTRNVSQYPLLILSTLRYTEYGSKPYLINLQDVTERKIPYEEIEVREFSEPDLRNFAETHLEGPIAKGFYGVLTEKTNGNPFFAEQLLHYFIENELVERKDEMWQLKAVDTDIPDTLNAVLIARIDRLTEHIKEVVKTAAVIGREFDVRLLSKMLKKEVKDELAEVRLVEKSGIWQALQELLYMFRHALLRDIAYAMQLKARLRELHQLAAATIETLYAPHLTRWYADLAFHYEKAKNRDKAIDYLQKAGDEAKAQYQNQQALHLYDRLLVHLQDMFGFTEVEIDTLLKKAEILELTGEWKACQQVSEEALDLSKQIDDQRRMGQANRLLGIISRRTGQYDNAMTYFRHAKELFETTDDRKGIGQVLRSMGQIYWQKGDNDAAKAWYEKALKISEEMGDPLSIAKNTNNMGILYDIQGEYNVAMSWYQKSLQISEVLGEKLERSKILNNVGENCRLQGKYDAAMTYYEKALQLEEELGDKLHIVSTLNNIGLVSKAQDNYDVAMNCFSRAIAIGRELRNKYYLCECLIGKADTLFSLQRYEEARASNTEGLQIAEEIGRNEYILQGKVLSAKIDFALGNEDAPRRIEEILQQTEDDEEIATLHYELWKMTRNEDHCQAALKLYQRLYQTTPNIEYKERMEEMGGSD